MTPRPPSDEPTRPLPPSRPIETERTVVRTSPEETLWAEVLDRLGSVRTGLVVVAALALAALGVALWALLDDVDRDDASQVRVERLADRMDRLESRVGEAASESGVADIRNGQQALQRRLRDLEAAVEDSRAASQDLEELATAVEAVQTSVDALEQRLETLEEQQP